jgi:hypothetical protein
MSNQSDVKVTYLQKYTYDVLNSGYNVFLTGGAGTGKSFILRKFIEKSIEDGLNVMVTAPTGIAAINIGGVTLHRAFKIPVGPLTYSHRETKAFVSDELLNTDVLVIDEISMCRIDIFDFIATSILEADSRRRNQLKAPIQVVLCGDFFQLPPVITKFERIALERYYGSSVRSGFAYQSEYWKLFDFKYIILNEVVRQNNIDFINNLNSLRCGNIGTIDYFYNNSSLTEIPDGITLCGTRAEADKKNEVGLNSIQDELWEFPAETTGNISESDYSMEEVLKLKVGARVIILANNGELYANGSLGTVSGIYESYIAVDLDDGNTVGIERIEQNIYDYTLDEVEDSDNGIIGNSGKKFKLVQEQIGTIRQFPIKLAYAMTIHKSQGQTYEKVNLSPYSWDCGQLYVAISRMRSLSGLHFNYKPDPRDIVVSLDTIAFHNKMVEVANQTLDIHDRVVKKKLDNEDANNLLDLLSKL